MAALTAYSVTLVSIFFLYVLLVWCYAHTWVMFGKVYAMWSSRNNIISLIKVQ